VVSRRTRARPADPLQRSLTLATIGIVVALVASSAWSGLRLRRLDEAARQLAVDIAPQIDCLSRVRGALHAAERAPDADERARRGARLGELAHGCQVGGLVPAPATTAEFDAADAAMERRIRLVANRAVLIGPAIAEERLRAERAAVGVHCLAAVVALLGLGLVWLSGRSQARAAQAQALADENERRDAVERARELDLFASRVAHDLKAPLSAVALYLNAADGAPLTPHGRASVRQTVAGALDIVDALLDYARADGRCVPGGEAEVREVVEHVMSALAMRAHGNVHIDVAADLVVACPRGALRSALSNLLRNALEHGGGARGGLVDLRAERRGGHVRIEVRDDGPGVPEELLPRIFDPYVRGDARSLAGLGLGLATVRRIAESCGGAVGVAPRSSDRGGACFYLDLPVALTRSSEASPSSS